MSGPAKVRLPDGKMVDGVDVGVDESMERWSEIKLNDGTQLRVKLSVLSAARADVYDAEGKPTYSLNMAPVVVIVDVPANLMKKKSN
jgi:hypothetical protein